MKLQLSREEMDRIENDPYLTDKERQVFVLYYRRGWKIEDIALELEPPVSRRTVARILKSIRIKALR